MKSVKEKAYAKINLYLDVTAKRNDGFHEIETVMHSVTLADSLTVSIVGSGKRSVRLAVENLPWLPTDSKNIAYNAAMLYMERADIDFEISIKLDKQIPVAAGLAGGSSDAAAVLRAMNRLFDRHFTSGMLLKLASELGSDVPYCLLGGTALCKGRGERIERLPSVELYGVVAIANERVSTPAAYSNLDSLYSDFDDSRPKPASADISVLLSKLHSGGELCGMYNVFEEAVLPDCPGAVAIKSILSECGAYHTMMSGSGPSVFGLFGNFEACERAVSVLLSKGYTAFAVSSAK